jgi:hypothetical protein
MNWAFPAVCAALLAANAAGADEDPARDARLAAIDGHFREADGIIERAPPEVQNDADLRVFLGESALKFAHNASGEEKRQALLSARGHFAKVIEIRPAEGKAAAGVLQASGDLADLDKEARNFDDEKNETKFAIEFGSKALSGGVSTAAFKLALGRMYVRHVGFYKTMKDKDPLVAESAKAASLLAEAAVGSEQAGKILTEAAAVRLRAANLVHEGVPVESEKADDEALAAAIDLATQACNQPGAADGDYLGHLQALRLAHSWGMKLAVKPFMQPVVPPIEGVKLEIPRAPGWTREKPGEDWDLLFTRNLHEEQNDGFVQIFLKKHAAGDMALGKPWGSISDQASRQFGKVKGDFKEPGAVVEPAQLKGEVWHFEASGNVPGNNANDPTHLRSLRDHEWIWYADKKKDSVWSMKVKDWRRVPDCAEPDIAAFVASAIGDGVWPPGAAPAVPDPKKPPTPPKKK